MYWINKILYYICRIEYTFYNRYIEYYDKQLIIFNVIEISIRKIYL